MMLSRQNREVGANPTQSRYCNWYAVSIGKNATVLSAKSGKVGKSQASQKPGDLPDEVCSDPSRYKGRAAEAYHLFLSLVDLHCA